MREGHFFVLRSYFMITFASLMKAQVTTLVKLIKLS